MVHCDSRIDFIDSTRDKGSKQDKRGEPLARLIHWRPKFVQMRDKNGLLAKFLAISGLRDPIAILQKYSISPKARGKQADLVPEKWIIEWIKFSLGNLQYSLHPSQLSSRPNLKYFSGFRFPF